MGVDPESRIHPAHQQPGMSVDQFIRMILWAFAFWITVGLIVWWLA